MTMASTLFGRASALRKEGKLDEALLLLRDALRISSLTPEETDRAGRFIHKAIKDLPAAKGTLNVVLVGQFTTSWLVPAITAVTWGQGQPCLVSEGGYDNILQDLNQLAATGKAPDVVIFFPWTQRLFGGSGPVEQRVDDELGFWKMAWDIAARMGSRVLQVGYDWITPGPDGFGLAADPGNRIDLIRAANSALRQNRPQGSYFLDLELVSGSMGRETFYDQRRYYWTKQPFSESGVVRLANHLAAAVRALTTGPKKVLVLDLDNTLWGGVVGELGPLGVALGDSPDGDAFRSFQKFAKELAKRGVVLALASKNNLADGQEPFEKNPDMVLKLEDIAASEINWDPKGTTIRRLAETLSLGLDSFVFFDDNPAEREQVRQAIPEVTVVEAPVEPAEYVRALESGLWFETTGLTQADLERSEQYAVERKRRELQHTAGSMEDYLRSLEMKADLREIDDADLMRVVQLLSKTNQFNVTTRRHSRDEVVRLLGLPGAFGLTLRVEDRFGDHGLIGVVIAVPESESGSSTLRIDTLLMSCRVIGRTVEQFFFGEIIDRAKALDFSSIAAQYIPSKKNALVSTLFDTLGMTRTEVDADQTVHYTLDLAGAVRPVAYLVPKELAHLVESA